MRLAVIADIHGNYRALQAVLDDIAGRRVDAIVSLGDTIGYGPEPEEVVRELAGRGIFSIMGNHELALVSPSYYARLNPSVRLSLDLTRKLLSPASLCWLASLHPLALRHGARLVHGCPPASITTYLFNPSAARLQRVFQGYPERICFSGHTHALALFIGLPSAQSTVMYPSAGRFSLQPENRYLVQPGSVGQPRDQIDNSAKYVIWDQDDDLLEIYGIPYDVSATADLLHRRGFPASNAARLRW